MRAMVYQGPGERTFTEVRDPEITDDADVIVRVDVDHDLRRRPAHPGW